MSEEAEFHVQEFMTSVGFGSGKAGSVVLRKDFLTGISAEEHDELWDYIWSESKTFGLVTTAADVFDGGVLLRWFPIADLVNVDEEPNA